MQVITLILKQFIKHVAKHNTFYHVAAPLAQTLIAEYYFSILFTQIFK